MRSAPTRTGVCVVRVESRGSALVITVRTNADVEHPCGETVRVVTEPDEAVELVRAFLRPDRQ